MPRLHSCLVFKRGLMNWDPCGVDFRCRAWVINMGYRWPCRISVRFVLVEAFRNDDLTRIADDR